jgi:HlyD family secretion protein
LQIGDSAEIEVDSYSYLKKLFKGVVTSIANSAVETASAEAVTEFKVDVKIDPSSYQDLAQQNPKSYPFRPGMTASLEIITNRKSNVLSVPLSAVASRSFKKDLKSNDDKSKTDLTEAEKRRMDAAEQKSEVVFVYKDGIVKMRKVKTGIADFEQVEIIEGLSNNEKIVTGPFSAITKNLEDGDEVRLKSREKSQKVSIKL